MAIAGWLIIGVALLVLVAVLNNSWQPLFDTFRQAIGGPAPGAPSPGGAAPAAFTQSNIPEGTARTRTIALTVNPAVPSSMPGGAGYPTAQPTLLPGQVIAPGDVPPTA